MMGLLTFAAVIACGFLGVIAHWFNRYAQGRTENSFKDYLLVYRTRTISSLVSVFASSAALYQFVLPEMSLATLLSAFTAGYTIDSVVNKEQKQTQE